MRIGLIIIALLAAVVFGYGYWHVSSRGWFYVSLYDVSNRAQHGRISDAHIVFLDAGGTILAEGKSDDRDGVVHMAHPVEGFCTEREQNAPFSQQAREAWQECFDKQSTWLMQWVREVNTMDLRFGNCQLDRIPVKVRESKGDWWLWWVPHPHIGGKPYTSFNLRIEVNGKECKARP